MCQDNEKQFCSSPCSVSCVCHKWVVEIWSEWSISYWTVLFYCWQLKVTEKQGQCQTVSNWKPSLINVRCWLVLLDEIRTTVEWILLHRMSWLSSLPFQCFFNLTPLLILWQKGPAEQEFWVRQIWAQTKQKWSCSKGNWNHMDFYATYVWAVVGDFWGATGPGGPLGSHLGTRIPGVNLPNPPYEDLSCM